MKIWAFWYIYRLCSKMGPVGCRETREAETGALARKPRQTFTMVTNQIFTSSFKWTMWQQIVEPSGTIRRATLGKEHDKSKKPIFSHLTLSFPSPVSSSAPSSSIFLLHCWIKKASISHSFSDQNSIGNLRWNHKPFLYTTVSINQGKGELLSHEFYLYGAFLDW